MRNTSQLPALRLQFPVLEFVCTSCGILCDDELCAPCVDAENVRIFAADDDEEICGCPCESEGCVK